MTKVNDEVLAVWHAIMEEVPNSHLLLKGSLVDNSEGKQLFLQSFGGSILKNVGLEFACAENVNEYVKKAVAIAGDRDLLNALHLGIRNMMLSSKIMYVTGYMKEYEDSFLNLLDNM